MTDYQKWGYFKTAAILLYPNESLNSLTLEQTAEIVIEARRLKMAALKPTPPAPPASEPEGP